MCCAAEVDSLQQQLQQSAQATAAAEQREAEASQAAQAQATAAIAAAAKAESSAALVAGGGSAADGGAQPEPEEDQGGKTAESSGQEVSKGDKERQQQADRARRAAEEAAAAAEAEAGAGQSPTRLDHVRMGGVGASIAAERRKLSALKKEVKGQRWVATDVSRCLPAAIISPFCFTRGGRLCQAECWWCVAVRLRHAVAALTGARTRHCWVCRPRCGNLLRCGERHRRSWNPSQSRGRRPSHSRRRSPSHSRHHSSQRGRRRLFGPQRAPNWHRWARVRWRSRSSTCRRPQRGDAQPTLLLQRRGRRECSGRMSPALPGRWLGSQQCADPHRRHRHPVRSLRMRQRNGARPGSLRTAPRC